MNFIKNSIFCHQPEEEEAYREEPENQMLAVWGVRVRKNDSRIKLAMRLAMQKQDVALLLCDLEYANAALYLSSGGAGRRAFFRKYPRSSPCDGESCAASLYYP